MNRRNNATQRRSMPGRPRTFGALFAALALSALAAGSTARAVGPAPIAHAGGPYTVAYGGTLALIGTNSAPSDGASLIAYDWDLDDDRDFGDATGATPPEISDAELEGTWGMTVGVNRVSLRVVDSSGQTNIADTTVTLLPVDSDFDGMPDFYELANTTPPSATALTPGGDDDGDNLTNLREYQLGTMASATDSDGDGAGDWYEVTASFTSPTNSASKPSIPYPLPKPDGSKGATNKPVKVFILSGQSNMVGMGNVDPTNTLGTLARIVRGEGKFPNLVDTSGNWSVRSDVIYKGVISDTWTGALTVADSAIGPELGFGHVMGYYFDEPVLLLKSCIGNRALGWDFRPPGSPQYDDSNGYTYPAYGGSPERWITTNTPTPIGWYCGREYDNCFLDEADWSSNAAARGFTAPVSNAVDVLDHFATSYPQWSNQSFQIAGYVWWQGNRDIGTGPPYPETYETNMVRFIKHLRAYYASRYPGQCSTNTPFVIATGCGDPQTNGNGLAVANAQLAVSGERGKYPEFAGNVKTMDIRGYWRSVAESPVDQGYHYNRNAETYVLTGDALGRGMISLFTPVAAHAGGPYTVRVGETLALNGTNSLPSDGASITNYSWDLNHDSTFGDATGATPTVSSATLMGTWGMTLGANPIRLRVIDSSGQTNTAATTVTLLVAITADATLTSLVPSAGALSPTFASTTFSYTASVPYLTNSLAVTPTAAAGTSATITVNGAPVASGGASGAISLNVGANVITTVVVSPDLGATNTYTLTVTREVADATLSSLVPSDGTLSPAFAGATFSYTAGVPFVTTSMTLTATATDPGATITVNGAPVASGSASGPISLSVGANVIATVVVAQDLLTTNTYTLTVAREAPDATLTSLVPSVGTLSPAFAGNIFSYAASVRYAVSSITVTATATVGTNATITVNGAPVVSGTASDPIGLSVGANVITTVVLSEDLSVTNTYTLTVTRTLTGEAVYWDGGSTNILADGNGASAGGGGTWNTTILNWDGGAVPHVAWNNANNDTAIFGGAAGTVTNEGVTVGGMAFTHATGTYIITNGTVTFGAAGTISNSAAVTIRSVIAGTGPVTKAGAGTLTLSGNNTFSGDVIIHAGTLDGLTANSLGSGTNVTFAGSGTISPAHSAYPIFAKGVTVDSGVTGTVSLGSQFYKMTFTGPLDGSGALHMVGGAGGAAGALTFSNANNTFAGPLRMSSQGNASVPLTVNSLADSTNPIKFSGTTWPGIFALGAGTATPLLFSSRRVELGSTTQGGIIQNNNATAGNTITINTDLLVSTNGNKTLTLGGSNTGTNTFAGTIADGTGAVISLAKADAGTWILSGSNTYSGGATVSAGALKANGAKALGNGSVTVSAGTLVIDAANAMADTASLYLPSAAAKNLTMNAHDTVGSLYLAGVQQPNGAYTSSGAGTNWMNAGSGILTVGPAAVQPVYWDLDGATAGAGGATPAGTWNGDNAYWNALFDGTGSTNAWPAGATAAFSAGADATGAYTVVVDGTPDIGGLTFEEGAVTLTNGTALRLVSDALAFVATNRTATIATPISQDATARALTKSGPGTLILSAANSFSGATTLGGGTLIGHASNALGNGAVTVSAGTLQLADTQAMASCTSLNMAASTLLQLRDNTSAIFNTPQDVETTTGSQSFTVDVNNNGSGSGNTLTLGGGLLSSQPHGNEATLNLTGGNGYALRLPTLTVARFGGGGGGGKFILNPTTAGVTVDSVTASNLTQTVVFQLGGTHTGNSVGAIKDTSSGTLSLTIASGAWSLIGSNYHKGATTLSGGTLALGHSNALSTTTFTITGGNLDSSVANLVNSRNNAQNWSGNFTFRGTENLDLGTGTVRLTVSPVVTISNALATLTVGGPITGAFGVVKSGAGALKLTGKSTYTGATTVSSGTLLVHGSIGTNATVTVLGGTLGGAGTIGGSVNLAAGGSLAPGASAGTLTITNSLNIATQAAGTGKLYFELDAPAGPSDRIAVRNTLAIGDGVLGFSDFVFTNLGGLATGTYKLITSGTLSGSLDGADLGGAIGALTGTLQIAGNDLELVVTTGGGLAPTASFTVSPGTSGVAGVTLFSFADTSSGAPTSWHWDFGDLGSSTVSNPTHTYADAGPYSVSLVASNAHGASSPYITNITVITVQQSWEAFYGVLANGSDRDGDRVSNGDEFQAGFNPTNGAAFPRILSISRTGSDIIIVYHGSNGDTNYVGGPASRANVLDVSTASTLGGYNFAGALTNVLGGGNGSGIVTNAVELNGATNGPGRYYRVRITAP